jgi:predicted lactoylglutathione lyase
MKRLLLFVAGILLAVILKAQTSAVDEMFNKYSERDGFTVVTISSKMFSMFANQDAENNDADDLVRRLKSIRILSVEDSLLNRSINFYTELGRKLNLSVYEELLVVKEGKDVTKFLIRQNGNMISELLVITGGPGGNSLISIKGEFELRNIQELSNTVGIQELNSLNKLDNKKPKE